MIRSARPQDGIHVVPLIFSAYGDIAYTLTGETEPKQAMDVLLFFFEQRGNRLSFENTIVFEALGRPVGFALFYHGSQTEKLDKPFADRLIELTGNPDVRITKEAKDDEFYLDALAVDPGFRRKGIGKALMEAFEAEAARRGNDHVALIVEQANEAAKRLYQSQGYGTDGELEVSGHLYDHMIKRIPVLGRTTR